MLYGLASSQYSCQPEFYTSASHTIPCAVCIGISIKRPGLTTDSKSRLPMTINPYTHITLDNIKSSIKLLSTAAWGYKKDKITIQFQNTIDNLYNWSYSS